jgi:spore maturation protein CgeB
MKLAFYGSSLLSSYWNGAATYYRGLIKALSELGYDVTFYEPDAFGRQERRDLSPPPWCRVVVYEARPEAAQAAAADAANADIVVKASGVGIFDDELLQWTMAQARPDAVRVWWDVDAPATLAALQSAPDHPLRRALRNLDAVLVYGGGPTIEEEYRALGARRCATVHNGLDPASHHPVAPDSRFAADMAFLGNRLPDRDGRVETFFFEPARRLPGAKFLLGGAGWEGAVACGNVRTLGHVPTADHNVFNVTPRFVLNVNRDSMARRGYAPPTRVFEAAGAGACLLTDDWPGIDMFLQPGTEVLVARDAQDVVECVRSVGVEHARAIGRRARARMLAQHSYRERARQADTLFRTLVAAKRQEAAA